MLIIPKLIDKTLTLIILTISLIILNGLSYLATTKEHSTIVVRNYGDSCKIRSYALIKTLLNISTIFLLSETRKPLSINVMF